MGKVIIRKESLEFLKKLAKNNDRDWFNKHKSEYLEANANIVAFADALLDEMRKHDKIETASGKKSVFRIYKDIRFSKDKTPYKTHMSGSFKRATKKLRGGYYFHIQPGASFLAGGFWGPEPDDLKRIRQDIDANPKEWKKLLTSKAFTGTFGKIIGDKVASAPKGYSKDHPAIDLLRYKQFMVKYSFSDKEVLSPGFVLKVNGIFKKMRPFFNHMSEVLTTDLNGVSVVD